MAIMRLPRLAMNWFSQPDLFRRYWDQFASAIEDLRETVQTIDAVTTEVQAEPLVVADLTSPVLFTRRVVTDATTKVFGDVVVGGGTEIVPVYFDGTDWRIG